MEYDPLESWDKLRLDAEDNPSYENMQKIVESIERTVVANPQRVKDDQILQNHFHEDFDAILAKYPYLTQYWRKYVTIEYTVNGLTKSVEILERAVNAFPQSLDLWIDYINIELANKLDDKTSLESLFERAKKNIGRQFLSHRFWDVYLPWQESNKGRNSNEFLNLYLELIQIPLHQYARYFEAFTELRQNFAASDLLGTSTDDHLLDTVLKKHRVKREDLDDKPEVLDDYFGQVFASTQKATNDSWKYEKCIERTDFDPSPLSSTDLDNWTRYLTFEESQGDFRQIVSLYERCLITTYLYEQFWMSYLKYLETQPSTDLLGVIERARAALPDQANVTYYYASYVERTDPEAAFKVYLSQVKEQPSSVEPISRIFGYLCRHDSNATSEAIACVAKYADEKPAKRQKPLTKSDKFDQLFPLLNDNNISQLLVEVAQKQWLQEHNVKATRRLLITYFKKDFMRSSVNYWRLFTQFEISQRNEKNVANIINYIKYDGEMPTETVNELIANYIDLALKNSTKKELSRTWRDLIRLQLEIDPHSSLAMKHFLKIRMDPDGHEENTNKKLLMENGQPPGVSVRRPRITNPIPHDAIITETPALPKLSGVESANAAAKSYKDRT